MNVYIDGESIIKQNQSIHDKDDDFKKIEDERQIFIIDMDERRKMIDKALTVLTTTKINDGVDTQLKYQRLL